ncbi:hypothetical protein [Lacipirellula limnantheis]|uniref:Uncharacterized protein n=1 Tax=Lacipirellula limnantheis TaxID=2528024 RepID=A0A517U573_9BACT|nr:hypothetical protein [Lacipirellula limnantheis]QDT75757.1 hypothetical protein I41_49990 [Lacipirellula limnantheis]
MRVFIDAIIGSSICLAVIAFVAYFFRDWFLNHLKRSLDHDFNEKIAAQQNVFDRHLAEMRIKHEIELERLRSDLRVDAFRNETRFSRLHADRAQAIADVYAGLRGLRGAFGDYAVATVDPADWPRLREATIDAFKRVTATFYPKEIYIPASTADKVHEYLRETHLNFVAFRQQVDTERRDEHRYFKAWQDVAENMVGKSKRLFEDLRDDFRRLLGDDVPPAAPADETK